MKKIVLTFAVAIAATSAFAQANATDETIHTSDAVQINGSLVMQDMIDLVPEFQTATNTANTWAEYNNGLQLNEDGGIIPNPPNATNPVNDIEMRVSATRPFKVAVKNSTWIRIALSTPAGVITTFSPSDFSLTGLASPEMVGVQPAPNSAYSVNGQWMGAWGNVSAGTQSVAVPLSGSDQNFLSADGCYNRQFDVRIGLRPGYGYNHSGLYTGVVTMTASLNP